LQKDLTNARKAEETPFQVIRNARNQPVFISGALPPSTSQRRAALPEFDYLTSVKDLMKIKEPQEEFRITEQQTDEQKILHVRMQQLYGRFQYTGSPT
jgi:Zn-dependent metalloprotease